MKVSVLERVVKTISRYNMLPSGTRVVVAVSGGADSVCLLSILRQIGANVVGIAHFNHQLRAKESEEDERFVGAISSRLDLPFYRAESVLGAGNLEQSARRARREFFLGLIRDGACDRVALGHTRDDQAETVLFRILRGSGLTGLAGIHPITEDGLFRPFIEVGRDEVREYLRSHAIEWREDSSNSSARFARNRIRHELLPQLRRDWNPRIDEALAQLGDLAFEEERWLSEQSASGGSTEFRADLLHSVPRALARRLIRQTIKEAKGDLRGIEFQHVEQILEMKPGKLRLPGVTATRSFGWVRLAVTAAPGLDAIEAVVPGTYEQASIRLEMDETPAAGCANLKVELAAPIVLRGWRPGDHYRPVGKSRDQKLKEMFQIARVPSWRRPSWPILECEGKILWAREFGAAEEFAVNGRPGPVLRVWDLTKES
jgi:tRNA(Ile)-lysidine synthase